MIYSGSQLDGIQHFEQSGVRSQESGDRGLYSTHLRIAICKRSKDDILPIKVSPYIPPKTSGVKKGERKVFVASIEEVGIIYNCAIEYPKEQW